MHGRAQVLLVQILKTDLNFGYKLPQWGLLESLNGEPVHTLAQVYRLYEAKPTWVMGLWVRVRHHAISSTAQRL